MNKLLEKIIFVQLVDSYSHVLAVKTYVFIVTVNRNHDNSQAGRVSAPYWFIYINVWVLVMKKNLFQWFDCYSSTFAFNVVRFRDIDLER